MTDIVRIGPEIRVNTATVGGQYNGKITALADGGFVVTWEDYSQGVGGAIGDLSGSAIKAQVFATNGTKVGPELLVNTATAGGQLDPEITALAGGGFVVTWTDFSQGVSGATGDEAVKAQIFAADGTKVGSELLVNTATANIQYNPEITALENGGFVVTWIDQSHGVGGAGGDVSADAVKAQIFAADGTQVGTEIRVNTAIASSQSFPEITALKNGGFVVTWTDYSQGVGGATGDTSGGAVKAQVFAAGGTKAGTEILVNAATVGDQFFPEITALENGGFVVTWEDYSAGVGGATGDTSSNAVKAQVFAADASRIGTEVLVNTATANGQFRPEITALANGGYVVTWEDHSQGVGGATGDASSSAVKAQVFTANGTRLGTEILVNTATTNEQFFPEITALANGGFVVTWTDYSQGVGGATGDTSSSALKAQAFAADGTRIGSEIRVNTATADFQGAPQITAQKNGSFVVTWFDLSLGVGGATGDTDGSAVKAQVFAARIVGTNFGDDLIGTQGDDVIHGLGGHDVVSGGAGADTFVIGLDEGLDTITDLGVDDKIDFTGVAFGAGLHVVLQSTAYGVQTFSLQNAANVDLASVKLLGHFAPSAFTVADDGTGHALLGLQPVVQSLTATQKFNGDAFSDLLLQKASGQAGIWLMNGTQLAGGALVGPALVPWWKLVDSGDFDGDGKLDLLWQEVGGAVGIWRLGGTSILSTGLVANPGASWKAVGTGDFNGDGMADVVLRHTNGAVAIWELDGTSFLEAGVAGTPGASWNVIEAADFDRDGKSDLLLQNADGTVAIWEMEGTKIDWSGIVASPDARWKVVGTGDFNGDSKADILLQNADGTVGIWTLDGAGFAGGGLVGNPGTSWQVVDTGDFNGDGKSDIVLQNTTGSVAIWEIDGTSIIKAEVAASPGADWLVV